MWLHTVFIKMNYISPCYDWRENNCCITCCILLIWRKDGVCDGASVTTCASVKMKTERHLHLENTSSSHVVKIVPHCVNGKGRGGNAVMESSQHWSWSAETLITGCGYMGKWFSFWRQSIQLTVYTKTYKSAEWNHWIRHSVCFHVPQQAIMLWTPEQPLSLQPSNSFIRILQ